MGNNKRKDKEKSKNSSSNYKNESKRELDILIGDIYLNIKNQNQQEFCKLIDEKEIIICSGPAGVGKSFLSVIKALELLKEPKNEFYKIIIVTPAVEAEERLGHLPGTAEEKLAPYLYSTIYLFNKILGERNVAVLRERNYIQVLPLAYARGINIDNSILIAEEFQNSTPRQFKTLITRIGHHSKFIISGDLEQSDRFKNMKETGLYDAMNRLKGIEKIGFFNFSEKDIVRNSVITEILEKYKD